MKTKKCTKCGETKGLDCFNKHTRSKDGLRCDCKDCVKIYRQENKKRITDYRKTYGQANRESIAEYKKTWQEENKERLTVKRKIYHQNNKESHNKKNRAYHKANKEAIAIKSKVYQEANKEAITIKKKIYNQKNKEAIATKSKVYREANKENIVANSNSPATTEQWLERIPAPDKPLFENGQVTVECKLCRKRFAPSKAQIKHRSASWEGKRDGESNFYHSNACRDACPLYNFNTQNTDPKSKLYIPKTEQQKARNCQTNHLKELQIDETGNTYCEKCGKKGPVDLHHTKTIQKNGMQAVSSAGHILLCKNCHINLHKECGK